MNRLERLKSAADLMESKQFAPQCRRLEREYQSKKLRTETVEVFTHLLKMAEKKNKKAAWLGICVLNSSLVTGSHEVLLSLYDSGFYLDSAPLERYWRPPLFAECFEEDMETVLKELKKQFPRIWQYEVAAIRGACAEYYYAALSRLCFDLGREIKTTETLTAFFGRYHGEGEILWHTGEQ